MSRKIVAANWKMHGSRAMVESWIRLIRPIEGVELVLFPPVGYIGLANEILSRHAPFLALGAQNVHEAAAGAFTGEASAEMVADLGGRYVIAGHLERRRYSGESDARIANKVRAAYRAGLQPILCVGETLAERSAGEAEAVVARQLTAVTAGLNGPERTTLIVAYEPVWAIGTGKSASALQVEEMHNCIRGILSAAGDIGKDKEMTVLYGGSVSETSADGLFQGPSVDGALVGGVALDGARFMKIGESLRRAKRL
ncbi:MAG: triose-phosphate isomerase [Gammaproteobacteria bacterium]|nr:triose-phosphate isomerase [Gammaproteobacteria bacterium]